MALKDIPQLWSKFSEKTKLKLLEKLIKMGRFSMVQQLLNRTTFSARYRLKARFYQGALYKNTGRHAEAVKIYRSLLAKNPKLHRVRLELGHTLFLMKEDQSAKHHLRLVLASGTSVRQQRIIQAFLNAIDRRKKWNVNAYLTLAPSTNMNQGTENTSVTLNGNDFTIDEASKKKSGIGLNAGLSVGRRFPMSENLDFVTSAGGHIRKFLDKKFDDINLTGSVGPRLRFNKGHVALYGNITRRWFAQEAYSQNIGASANLSYRLSPKDALNVTTLWEHRRFDERDYQNSDFYKLYFRNDHYFNSHSFVRLLGGVSKEDTVSAHLDYKSWQVGLGLYKELPLGLSVYAQGQFTEHKYSGLYPGGDAARTDKRLDAMLQLTKRDWDLWGYAPSIVYNYAKADSNIAFHEFDSHNLNLTFSKNF